METYSFAFKIEGFDQWGEEHRLVVHTTFTFRDESGLPEAAKALVTFAAKLVNCQPNHLAAERIMVKSVWKSDGKKRTRVTPEQLKEAIIKAGFASKGREEQRVVKPSRPSPLGRRVKRR